MISCFSHAVRWFSHDLKAKITIFPWFSQCFSPFSSWFSQGFPNDFHNNSSRFPLKVSQLSTAMELSDTGELPSEISYQWFSRGFPPWYLQPAYFKEFKTKTIRVLFHGYGHYSALVEVEERSFGCFLWRREPKLQEPPPYFLGKPWVSGEAFPTNPVILKKLARRLGPCRI